MGNPSGWSRLPSRSQQFNLDLNDHDIIDVNDIYAAAIRGRGGSGDDLTLVGNPIAITGPLESTGAAITINSDVTIDGADLAVIGNIGVSGTVDGNDVGNLGYTSHQQRVITCGAINNTGSLLTADTAYFLYVGYTLRAITASFYVKVVLAAAGTVSQTGEMGAFSTPAAPNGANQTVTKIDATGTLDSMLVGAGEFGTTSALTADIPISTHLWLGMRTDFGGTEPNVRGFSGNNAVRRGVLQTATAGALTSGTSWTGVPPAYSSGFVCPDLYMTLDA